MDTELTNEQMLQGIRDFLSTQHDYNPHQTDNKVIGCYNSSYHDGVGSTYVYPPFEYNNGTSIPTLIIAYELLEDGRIILCTSNLIGINLKRCLGDSVKYVFEKLIEEKN